MAHILDLLPQANVPYRLFQLEETVRKLSREQEEDRVDMARADHKWHREKKNGSVSTAHGDEDAPGPSTRKGTGSAKNPSNKRPVAQPAITDFFVPGEDQVKRKRRKTQRTINDFFAPGPSGRG